MASTEALFSTSGATFSKRNTNKTDPQKLDQTLFGDGLEDTTGYAVSRSAARGFTYARRARLRHGASRAVCVSAGASPGAAAGRPDYAAYVVQTPKIRVFNVSGGNQKGFKFSPSPRTATKEGLLLGSTEYWSSSTRLFCAGLDRAPSTSRPPAQSCRTKIKSFFKLLTFCS
jgi:hypothetical protein